jgi:hypothetical protein
MLKPGAISVSFYGGTQRLVSRSLKFTSHDDSGEGEAQTRAVKKSELV